MQLSSESQDVERELLVSVHVCDFRSVFGAMRWVAAACRPQGLAASPGSRFAKTMLCVGTKRSAGFSLRGVPDLRRVVTFLVWDEERALDSFLSTSSFAQAWEGCSWAWHLRARPFKVMGTFGGEPLLTGVPRSLSSEGKPIVSLTIGRSSRRNSLEFTRLTPPAEKFLCEPGFITGVSAGVPPRGVGTCTLWESEADMTRFAYKQAPADHRHAVHESKSRATLLEQFSARLLPLRIDGEWDPANTPHADRLDALARTLATEATPGPGLTIDPIERPRLIEDEVGS
jgi:hypothetical protein